MTRSAAALAALLSAAMPAVDPVAVTTPDQVEPGLDAAVVTDAAGARWDVRAPLTAAAGAALEREVAVLGALSRAARLPFQVPVVVARVLLDGEQGRAVVTPHPEGVPLTVELLASPAGRGHLAPSVGRALAAVHELPASLAEDAGAPSHTAAGYRARRLDDLDRAAATGLVPSVLLERWEAGLEDSTRWRFHPVVVHGDLAAEDLVVSRGAEPHVVALGRWGSLRVADPADDLAWLAASASEEALDAVLAAYARARSSPVDPHLLGRAELVGELALAEWLLHGVRVGDDDVVQDAHAMLVDLESTAAHREVETR